MLPTEKKVPLFYKKIITFLLLVAISTAQSQETQLRPKDAHLLMVGFGAFDIFRWSKGQQDFESLIYLEARPDFALFYRKKVLVRPLLGWMLADLHSNYVCAGLAFDFFVSPHLTITPSFAPGYWFKGNRIDLGYPLEFRTSMELAYRFKNKGRFGLMFSHISNAHLGKNNPGADMLSIYYAIPLSWR